MCQLQFTVGGVKASHLAATLIANAYSSAVSRRRWKRPEAPPWPAPMLVFMRIGSSPSYARAVSPPIWLVPVGHARVGEAGEGEEGGVGLGRVVVGEIGGDALVVFFGLDGLPHSAIPAGVSGSVSSSMVVSTSTKGDCGDDAANFSGACWRPRPSACAGGAAFGDDAAVRGETFLHQMVGGGDEVLKGVFLALSLPSSYQR